MRGIASDFNLVTAKNLLEVLNLLKEGYSPFAGGTDLMVLFEAGILAKKKYVSLWGLRDLCGIRIEKESVIIGAATPFTDVIENRSLARLFPDLIQAAKVTGSKAIQNRGTIGGNIANASPAADTPPVLLARRAQLELTSLSGSRWIEYRDFHLDYKKTALREDELISAIRIPIRSKMHVYYRKVGTRNAQAISKVVLSSVARFSKGLVEDISIGVGSVAPFPKACTAVESFLQGKHLTEEVIAKVQGELLKDISPIDDIRSTRSYRLRVAQNCLADFLESLR